MADKDNEMMFETDDVAVIDTTGDQSIEATDINQVIAFIESRFKRAEDARLNDEQRWLKAYKNYRGVYGSDVQFTETEKSRVFVKVTKTKTLAAYGQIIEVLFGSSKFPLSINPTILPDGVAESVHLNTDPNVTSSMDTIKESEYENTNKLFKPPHKYDLRITKWIDEDQLFKCLEGINHGTKDIQNFSDGLMQKLDKL